MEYDTLVRLLDRFHEVRVLVLGDVMLDRFIYGSVERISPEAPIPIMAVERNSDMPGGASNVARNIAAMGARAILIGVVGKDESAGDLQERLADVHGIEPHLVADRTRPTTVKTRFVADRQQVLRADSESRAALTGEAEQRVLLEYQKALKDADIVVLSDYAKGVLSDRVAHAAIAAARHARKKIVVDPKSKTFTKYANATVLTPNRLEMQLASGQECSTDEQVVEAARRIVDSGVCEAMVVTRGKEGMSVVCREQTATHLRALAREVYDVSGAGDTVVATLALGLAAGGSVVDSSNLANVAAGIVVGKLGTAVTTTGEVVATLNQFSGRGDASKIFALENVAQLVRYWREQGLRIAVTNGCFDLLHPGHVSLLEQARRTADRLVVCLNSDASVRRLKGAGRPVQSEVSRATVLASLKSVDAVVIFGEDTPLELIKALQPDVLVKGADYAAHEVVGADIVIGRGGKVVLADLVSGHSTTTTVKRVAAATAS